jgi:hypothetical protein
MTTLPPLGDDGQDLPAPDRAEPVGVRLQAAEIRLACCRADLTRARRDVRSLRRQQRRERLRELRAKVGPRVVVFTSAGLAVLGAVAFAVAVVLLLMGEFSAAKDVLMFAGVAWGGAAAIRTRRK